MADVSIGKEVHVAEQGDDDSSQVYTNHENKDTEKSTDVVKKHATVVMQPEHQESDGGEDDEDNGGNNGEDESTIEDLLADLPDDTDEIELVHSRLSSLQNLRLPRFGKYLKKLCLRQNNLAVLEPDVFGSLGELEELDLYDNKLKGIDNALNTCSHMTVLDLSFNLLRAVPDCLSHFPKLRTIFFVQNKISHISGLSPIGQTLTSLELGGNRIRKIENLEELVNLEELWLGKNKIAKLEGLDKLHKLKILSIQSNRIEKIEGLEELSDLEEFYISHNGIKRIEGLEKNKKLRVLDIGNNFIQSIEGLEHLSSLEEVWASGNQISSLEGLERQLGDKKDLETIYLEHNPVQRTEGTAYRRKISLALPQLKQIDATFVKKF